jgi:hypothetical protein
MHFCVTGSDTGREARYAQRFIPTIVFSRVLPALGENSFYGHAQVWARVAAMHVGAEQLPGYFGVGLAVHHRRHRRHRLCWRLH